MDHEAGLTVGSVVYLKEGTAKLVILATGQLVEGKDGEKPTFFDYLAGLYPQGYDASHMYYFNQNDIDRVVFRGFEDDESKRYQDVIADWQTDHAGKYQVVDGTSHDEKPKQVEDDPFAKIRDDDE